MKNFVTLIAALAALAAPAHASKIQQQAIVTSSDCTTRGISNSSCLPLTSQLYDSSLSEQVSAALSAGDIHNKLQPMLMHQQTTPANPSSGYDKCYVKSDDNLYCLNSSGTETKIGSGGGGGSSGTNLSALIKTMEDQHFGIMTGQPSNAVGSGFFAAPSVYYEQGILLQTVSSGQTSIPLVWNPIVPDNAHKNTDVYNGTATWTANSQASSVSTTSTGGHYAVGSGAVQWTKTTGGTLSNISYNEGSASLGLSGNSDVLFTIYIPTAANVSNVWFALGTSTSVYQFWTTTTNSAGGSLANGLNEVEFNISSGGTPASTGWNYLSPAQYIIVGVTTVSSTNTDTFAINGMFFGQTQSVAGQQVPPGSGVTIYDNSHREENNIDSANTVVSGSTVVTTTNLSNTYVGGFGSTSATIARETLALGSNQAAMTDMDQFTNTLAGNAQYTQEARLSTALPSALSGATVDAFADVFTSQVYTVQTAPTSTTVNISDPVGTTGDMLSGEKFLVYRPVYSPGYGTGSASFIKRGTMTLSTNSTGVSTTGTVSSSSTPSCITSVGSTTGIAPNDSITDSTHAYIPANTVVLGIGTGPCSSGQIQMSNNATNSSSGDTITVGASTITCTGGGCVPSGTAVGDIVVKDHLKSKFSSVSLGSNESYSTLTPMAAPNDVLLFDTGIPYPYPGNVWGHWLLGGQSAAQAQANQFGPGPALTLNGSLGISSIFKNGQFGVTGFSNSNSYSIPGALPIAGSRITASSLAYSIWVYYPGTTSGSVRVIFSSKNVSGNSGYELGINSSASTLYFDSNDGTNAPSISSGSGLLTGWNHILVNVTTNAAFPAGAVTIWLNGSSVASSTTFGDIDNATNIFVIGNQDNNTNTLGTGPILADFIVWRNSPTFTSAQVNQIYNNGLAVILGFGPKLEYLFENTGIGGQFLSQEEQLATDTVNVRPWIGKMGITVH